MAQFQGFSSGKTRFIPIPAQFFTDLLPEIDDLNELKVTLYTIWRLDRMEGNFRYLRKKDFIQDKKLMNGLAKDNQHGINILNESLFRAIIRGSLLQAEIEPDGRLTQLIFLNTARGQAAVKAISNGDWQPSDDPDFPISLDLEKPNIFRLYEQHIGPLTPMIADMLKEAEDIYPAAWVEEAMRIAVGNNVRKWRYVDAILNSWQEEGRDDRTNKKGAQEDHRKYIEGKFSKFIEH